MKPVKAKAKFIYKKQLARTVYEFKFQMVTPKVLDFEAGQYVSIKIDQKTRRQYSISTSPLESRERFTLLVDIKPGGVGIRYLMNLENGSEVLFIGQIGNFVLPGKIAPDLFFISTGTGVAPLKSMIETLILDGRCRSHDVYLYFGTRTHEDVFYNDLFRSYTKRNKIVDYRIYLSRGRLLSGSDRNPPGYDRCESGYVTKCFGLHATSILRNAQFFVCGNGEMIKSVKKNLVKKGVLESSIFYEKFY